MTEISTAKKIENIIKKNPKTTVYTIQSFRDIDNYDNIRKILSRMVKNGKLSRVSRGFYKPVDFNEFLGEETALNQEDFVKAYAEFYKLSLAPCGDTALNVLGLSSQVPNVYCYVTDGPSKVIKLADGREVEFKHRTIREISSLSFKEAALVEALKFLGSGNITEKVEKIILKRFSYKELKKLKIKANQSRNWIYEEINKLLEMSKKDV